MTSLLANDPLTQVAFSLHENKGVFALLLGSGFSRSAEIPTGWEITLDLIRRVALAQGVAEQVDWAAWYREQTGIEPSYSTLLADLASSPEERRSILHRYIEPTQEDREQGRKTPTPAHQAVADLVRRGYVRVIVTTNFDRLIENALREHGIEPTVVASVDALQGAEPITHSACFVLKLHGDYKDARILNTDAELSEYPPQYVRLLDRILDEHGLLVCGWSGDWDHALRDALLRAPNRRYPVYWAARGQLGDTTRELLNHRGARALAIADADTFFTALRQRVETLEQTHQQNPLSVELLINSAKRLLPQGSLRIQLDALFGQETDRVLSQLDAPGFDPQKPWDQAEFRARVRRYEAVAEPLAGMMGVLGRWGSGSELPLAIDVIRGLTAHAERIGGGLVAYLSLRSYPAVLVFTAYGIGLTRAERWSCLHQLLSATLRRESNEPVRTVDDLFLGAWKGTHNDLWKKIEGLERRQTPLSEHLLILFSEWSKRFLGLTPDLEMTFEQFEVLGSFAHLERNEKTAVTAEGSGNRGWAWMPFGRAAWHTANANRLLAEMQAEPLRSQLFEAGFGNSDPGFMEVFVENFARLSARIR